MSRKLLAGILVLGLATVFILAGAKLSAQDTDNFTVKNFESDYFLSRNEQKTSLLSVVEKITAEFPDSDQNHGILRAIPKTYRDHTISLNIESVKNEQGTDWRYTTYSQNDNEVLKIGDADRFVHGEQTYVIRYSLRDVVQNFPEHDEFYWDVNGDQWRQVFEQVTARVHIPIELATSLQDRQVCYAGLSGSRPQDSCTIERTAGESETLVTVKTTRPLGAYETLTYVIGFEAETFIPGPEIAREQLMRKIMLAGFAVAIILPPAVAFFVMFRRWRQFGDDPKGRGVIVPEYQPPKNFNTLTSDFLLAQKFRNVAFSAALVELAITRYLNIHEIPDKGLFGKPDYELELVKSPDDLADDQKKVVEAVFSAAQPGAMVKISEIRKSNSLRKTIGAAIGELDDFLSSELHKKGFFARDPKKIKRGYLVWASIALTFGFVALVVLPIAPLGAGLILAALVVFFFAFYMPARTLAGVEAHDALLGLKDYIKLAETERLKFGQSPEGAEKIKAGSFDPNNPKTRVKLFESLLPYAMLFGLEKEWGKQFKNIYIKPPDWYDGNVTAFNAAYLGSSLGGFSSVSATTFSSPSSSSGSGFSGGGSSGGGGGGGGGGGW